MPDHGLLMSDKLARQLGVGHGETLEVEFMDGARETRRVPLAGTVRLHYGEGVYMDAATLAALRLTGPEINLVHISVDAAGNTRSARGGEGDTWHRRHDALDRGASQLPRHHGREPGDLDQHLLRARLPDRHRGRLQRRAHPAAERAHELASLRILGFSRGEVSFVLLGELLGLALLAIPLGCLLGYGFAALIASGFSTDTLTIPLVITRATYAYAALVVAGAAIVSALVVRRRIDRLDLVAVMKTRE